MDANTRPHLFVKQMPRPPNGVQVGMRASSVVVNVVPPLLALLLGFFVGIVSFFGLFLFLGNFSAHLLKGAHNI